jgi:ketosteroid isomerase-like protein
MTFTKLKLAAGALLMVATGSAILLGQASAQKSGDYVDAPRATPGARAEVTSSSDDQVEVEMLERAWAAAIPRRDVAVVNRILAEDYEGIDPVGNRFSKSTYIPDLKNGVFASTPIELDEVQTRVLGDTAIVTSRIKVHTWPTPCRQTNVYAKRRGRWQCVASHACAIGGATFSESAKAAWWRATPEWKQDGLAKDFDTWSKCTSCHTTDVHCDPPFRQSEAILSPLHHGRITTINAPLKCLVEKVRVSVGQVVRRGDPLIELVCPELDAAKIGDEIERITRQPGGEIVINEDKRGGLKVRFTLFSEVDGTILAVGAKPGSLYDRKDVLIEIGATPAFEDRRSPAGPRPPGPTP